MMTTYTLDKTDQVARMSRVKKYLADNVLSDSNEFICQKEGHCRKSCQEEGVDLQVGKMHHFGEHYSLLRDGKPFRIVVVGEQYGTDEEGVKPLESRREDILACRKQLPFKGGPQDPKHLNPHMTGTMMVLRFLFGQPLKTPFQTHDSNIQVDGDTVSMFDCFALTNYLLCSGIQGKNATTKATDDMWENCKSHIREVLHVLQPTHLVLQGTGKVWGHIRHIFIDANIKQHEVTEVDTFGVKTQVFSFYHPSTRNKRGWGMLSDDSQSYLRSVVETTIKSIK